MIGKLLRKKRTYVVIVFVLGMFFLYDALHVRQSDDALYANAADNLLGLKPNIVHLDTLNRRLRYIEIGESGKPLIVLLHGAPSSSSFWNDYLKDSKLLSMAKVIAPDRPGYGYSGYGIPELSVVKQAQVISSILKRYRNDHKQIILHGSSYGGTLAARLAMDYPKLVDGMILQSASTEPGAETTYDISYLIKNPPFSWFVPGAIQMANLEKLSHKSELESMSKWDAITIPTIILHGDEDGLIHPSNAEYTKNKLVNASRVEIWWAKGSGHTLAHTRKDLIMEAFSKMVSWTHSMK